MGRISVCIFIFLVSKLFAAGNDQIQIYKEGPVHEAYMVQELGEIFIQGIPEDPPENLTEEIPPQADQQTRWIPGYWAWSKEYSDFVWVSGVWRRPPPGMQWISGYWKRYSEGWVWIRGFWSDLPESKLRPIAEIPPDPIDEKLGQAPAPADSYFWVPGFWSFDWHTRNYVWNSGKWEALDVNWVYVPAHYIWREEGYVFAPPFWDWPLDQRGSAYAAAYILPNFRTFAVYEPSVVLEPLFILDLYYPYWPDYLCLYHAHFYYHFDLWAAWGAIPPWWNWNDWWALAWQDSWALWWWWSHPGYPNPSWIDAQLASKIAPPPEFVVKMMKGKIPPFNVTPNGVVGNQAIFKALKEATGKDLPILPPDPKQIDQIKLLANPKPSSQSLSPKGQRSVKQPPGKPLFGPAITDLKQAPQRVIIPSKPVIDEPVRPKLQQREIPIQDRTSQLQNGGKSTKPAVKAPSSKPARPTQTLPQKEMLPPKEALPQQSTLPPEKMHGKAVPVPKPDRPYPTPDTQMEETAPPPPPPIRFEPADTIYQPTSPANRPLQPRVDSRPVAPKLPENQNPLEVPQSSSNPPSTTTYPEYPSASPNTPQAHYPGKFPSRTPPSPAYPQQPDIRPEIRPNIPGSTTPYGVPPSTVNPPIRLEAPRAPDHSQPRLNPTPGAQTGPRTDQPRIQSDPLYYDSQNFRNQRGDRPAWHEDVQGEPRGPGVELDVFHGQKPTYEFPQNPMQIQPQDRFMLNPLPQNNPPGPKVHPFPDDEGRF